MPLEYALQHRGKFPDTGPWKFPRPLSAKSNAPIGIGDLQNMKLQLGKMFKFNILVAGESGLGKTTFMNTLFNSNLTEKIIPADISSTKTVEICERCYELTEEGVNLMLTIVDTPGFGDQLNRQQNFEPILKYIQDQYENYYKAETSKEIRGVLNDTLVHCVLYFLPPTGVRGLKALDRDFLLQISKIANVVPIISKADTLTAEEKSQYKQSILRDFSKFGIKTYLADYAQEKESVREILEHIPFCVIGSDKLVNANGKMIRGRPYRWGSAQVENPEHCDFIHLRTMLMDQNMCDLVDTTRKIHYLNHRADKLRQQGLQDSYFECDDNKEATIEENEQALKEEFEKSEREMKESFVAKVKEKEQALKEREEQLTATRQRLLLELQKLRKAVDDERTLYEEQLNMKSKK